MKAMVSAVCAVLLFGVTAELAVAKRMTEQPATAIAPTGPGVIRGSVLWKGAAPVRAALRRDSDPVCAKTAALDEAIVVTAGKLSGVLVRIKNGTAGTWVAPTKPVVLTQRACTYSPHVAGVQVGQPVAVDNDDPTYHNVRGERGGVTAFNESQPDGAPRIIRRDPGSVGDVLHLRCDVHPWMEAFVPVQDHPFFAVTTDDGAFEIRGLPAGKYVLEAWHPVLGLKSTTITIGTGRKATVNANFTYQAAKAKAKPKAKAKAKPKAKPKAPQASAVELERP